MSASVVGWSRAGLLLGPAGSHGAGGCWLGCWPPTGVISIISIMGITGIMGKIGIIGTTGIVGIIAIILII